MFDYTSPNYNINALLDYNNVKSLTGISMYLDFALFQTIHEQDPNLSFQEEQKKVIQLLNNYLLSKDENLFTTTYNIQENIKTIGWERIVLIFLKNAVEIYAYNTDIRKKTTPQSKLSIYAEDITKILLYSQLADDLVFVEIMLYLPTLIEDYVYSMYLTDLQTKINHQNIAYRNSNTKKAFDQIDKNLQSTEKMNTLS